jgi:predicted TIM-barrel fold metal-dependent hydrolase
MTEHGVTEHGMTDTGIFDFDNHYYEAEDAFTRHADRSLRNRGVRWADIDGRRRLLVGGALNSYIANPTFDPVAKPGALFDWYRGNPRRQGIVEAFGELEPIRPEYRDRDARLKVMGDQGLDGMLLFPTLGVGIEDALEHDPEACAKAFEAFNRWLEDDWGYRFEGRIFAVPYLALVEPAAAVAELRRVIDAGAVAVNVRAAPVAVPGGRRSPFDPAYDEIWGLAAEAGVVVATHAGIDAYDPLVQMWEPGGAESSLFRSPLRGIVTKGRGVSDFYAAALCHKVFDRFPGLRFASVENGASWAPALLHRLDDAANRNPGFFAEHPREQFGEHVWITPFWEDDVASLLADVRADRLLLGSDWPHAEGTREPADFVGESLVGLPAETVRMIARQNALDVLRISLA